LAALFRQYVDGLVAADTRCKVYQFHRDPRQCFDAAGRSHALADLSRRSFESRLIIMSDGAGLCDPVTAKPGAWIEDARAWDRRVIVSPKHPTLWSEIESSLQEEGLIPIVPATGRWIEYVAMRLSASAEDIREDSRTPEEFRRLAPLYYLLSDEPLRFIEEAEPSARALRLTGEALKHCLTPALHDWLAACAVFPVLNWQVTLFLGRGLLDGSGHPLLTEDRVLVLSQLPWFRQGWMPGWLRRLLISELSEDRYFEIRALLEGSLALDGSGALDSMPLRVTLERQTSEAGRPSATADAILLEFVLRQRGRGLDLHLVASAFLAALRQPTGPPAAALLATIAAQIDTLVGEQASPGVEAVEVAGHGVAATSWATNGWPRSMLSVPPQVERLILPIGARLSWERIESPRERVGSARRSDRAESAVGSLPNRYLAWVQRQAEKRGAVFVAALIGAGMSSSLTALHRVISAIPIRPFKVTASSNSLPSISIVCNAMFVLSLQ
jgi:hypothetical protein